MSAKKLQTFWITRRTKQSDDTQKAQRLFGLVEERFLPLAKILIICGRGEIGRRTGFRYQRREAWEFESPRPHHFLNRVQKMEFLLAFIGKAIFLCYR